MYLQTHVIKNLLQKIQKLSIFKVLMIFFEWDMGSYFQITIY